MLKKIQVSDGELEIIKVLWSKGSATAAEILKGVSGNEAKNRNTVKTLLLRLVQKKAVRYEEISPRVYRYYPVLLETEYVKQRSKNFIDKLFNGSTQKMLLNFVKDEQITKEDLQKLLMIIENSEK